MFLKLHQTGQVDFRSKPWRGQGPWGRHLDAPLNLKPHPVRISQWVRVVHVVVVTACSQGELVIKVVGNVSGEIHPGFLLPSQCALKGSQANEREEAAVVVNLDRFPSQTLLLQETADPIHICEDPLSPRL